MELSRAKYFHFIFHEFSFSRVSVEDSTSTTYLRVRPDPSKAPPAVKFAGRGGVGLCRGPCQQRRVAENVCCDGACCATRGIGLVNECNRRDMREEIGPEDAARLRDYDYLPTIAPDPHSTPPW